ncbi:hypothetical protein B0H67DRAFT_582902 [Lasiosphaeris hirsuta]|uniref:Flavin reductase like domain-containing protein n=1 Tax=Lasiosphaeris hirsuta TaxID=260670 RepID=A0AA40AIA1_9PEZI|nr:hypothetical protein B0H67DRAFT_582902 [Lasiosphaeris hirsuta]
MLYFPSKNNHNLAHDPFKACVVPRPIGWISTTSPLSTSPTDRTTYRHNLAPFSQFANLTFDPPYVMFAANQTPSATRKDTVRNVEATGKFVWNLATWDLRNEVNKSAQQLDYGVDEFEVAGLEKAFSSHLPGDETNPVPMVKRSPVRFECVYHSTLRLPGKPPLGSVDVVIGRVVAVYIADEVLTDGRLDVSKTKPIARCGYYEYAVVEKTFEMVIPGLDEVTLAGLEGSSRRVRGLSGKAKL